jgi:hypothetical protein
MKHKKGQISFVFYTIVVVILAGILLNVFSPTINEYRLERISEIDNYPDQNPIFMKIFLYGLFPLMWALYLLLSVIALTFSVRGGAGI